MSDAEQLTGFEMSRDAQDEYTARLWRKHGLGEHPSFAEMEPVAQRLMGDFRTFLEGASMVLCRHVGAQEGDIVQAMFFPERERFGLLLLRYGLEELKKGIPSESDDNGGYA